MKKSHVLLIAVFIGVTLVLSSCSIGPRVTGTPGVTLSGDMVFVSYSSFIYGMDAATGSVVWAYPDEADNQIVFYAPPLVVDEYVYVGDLANEFHKLDKETGSLVWTFSGASGYYIGQAAEADGVVYAPCNDGVLYALDQNGNLLWEFETGHYIWAQPLVTEDVVYISSMDHFVYAVSKDGEEIWSQELNGSIVSSPLLSEDESMLYVGTLGDEIAALDTTDGEVIWTYDTEDSVWGVGTIVESTLFIGDSVGNIYALDPDSGELLKQIEIEGSIIGGLTALDDGFALTTEEGDVKVLDVDGTPVWESTPGGEIVQAPAVSEDYVIIGSINGDNLIYSFSSAGVQLWSTTPEN